MMSAEAMRGIIEESHAQKLKVYVHARQLFGVGVDWPISYDIGFLPPFMRSRSAEKPSRSKRVFRHQARRATTINVKPTTNAANMRARSREVPGGASLNSFQMKTPHSAATRVAPCPSP